MPSNFDHSNFLAQMKEFGHKTSLEGLCAGLAQMGIQAALLGDAEFDKFNERIEFIASTSQLAEKAEGVKNSIALRGKLQRAAGSTKPVELTPDEQKIIDVAAFFEGIALYLQPRAYADLFDKLVYQHNVSAIAPFVIPRKLPIQSAEPLDSRNGIYNLMELTNYLNKLHFLLCSPAVANLAIGIENANHRISLFFNKKNQMWTVIDANQLPPSSKVVAIKDLAKEIFYAVGSNVEGTIPASTPFIATNTKIYSEKHNHPRHINLLANLQRTPEFKIAHDLNAERLSRKTSGLGVTLAHLAAVQNDAKDMQSIMLLGADLTVVYNLGLTPALRAVSQGSLDVLKVIMALQPALILAESVALTAISIAAKNNEVDTLRYLISQIPTNIPLAFLEKSNLFGESPFMIAAQNGSVEAMKVLAVHNVNLNKKDSVGLTAAHTAARNGNLTVLKALNDCGADLKLEGLINFSKNAETREFLLHISGVKDDVKQAAPLELKKMPEKTGVKWHFGPSPSVKVPLPAKEEPRVSVENLLKIVSQQFTKYEDLIGNLNDIKVQRAFSKELVEFKSSLEAGIAAKEIIADSAIVGRFENAFLKRIQGAGQPVNNLMFKAAPMVVDPAVNSKNRTTDVKVVTIDPKYRSS